MNCFMALLLLVLSPSLCRAEPTNADSNIPTALYFSHMTMQGLKDAAQDAKVQGKISDTDYDCISKLQIDALAATVNDVLIENFSKDEIKTLDEFYGSALGKKFASYTIEQARLLKNTSEAGSIVLSKDELDTVNYFSKTPSFIKLMATLKTIQFRIASQVRIIRNSCNP